MSIDAYGTTVFCDDIRFEASGKLTLVGCYTSEMTFSGPAPGKLPNFAALVNIRIPRELSFRKVELRVLKEVASVKEEIFQAELEVSEEQREEAFVPIGQEKNEEQVLSMTFPLQWSPLDIEGAGLIKVRAYLDGETEVRLGALKINFAEESARTGE